MIEYEENPGIEWQGALRGMCYRCHCEKCKEAGEERMEEKKFGNKSSKLWRKRRFQITGIVSSMRIQSFQEAKATTRKRPGQTSKQFRKDIMNHAMILAMKIVSAVANLPRTHGDAAAAEARDALGAFGVEWETKNANINYICAHAPRAG